MFIVRGQLGKLPAAEETLTFFCCLSTFFLTRLISVSQTWAVCCSMLPGEQTLAKDPNEFGSLQLSAEAALSLE